MYLKSFSLVSPLILGVHSDESEDEKIEGGGDDRQAEEDEDQGEHDVLGLVVEGVVLLQGDHVAEPDRRQRDEAVVDGVEVGPALVPGERRRATRDRQDRQGRHHAY